MKRMRKYAAVWMSAVLLAFGCPAKAQAAETVAPFTADQLMAVVNAQCGNISSVRQTITENVQVLDTVNQSTAIMSMTGQVVENDTVSHSVISTTMSVGMAGASLLTASTTEETYTAVENGVLTTWQKDSATGAWSVVRTQASQDRTNSAENDWTLSGISAAGAPVIADGQVYRFSGTLDASTMSEFEEILESSGIAAEGAFPVVVEVDAATFYPRSIVMGMPNLTVPGMPGMTANATAAIVYDGFNQFDVIPLP